MLCSWLHWGVVGRWGQAKGRAREAGLRRSALAACCCGRAVAAAYRRAAASLLTCTSANSYGHRTGLVGLHAAGPELLKGPAWVGSEWVTRCSPRNRLDDTPKPTLSHSPLTCGPSEQTRPPLRPSWRRGDGQIGFWPRTSWWCVSNGGEEPQRNVYGRLHCQHANEGYLMTSGVGRLHSLTVAARCACCAAPRLK